MYSPQFRHCPYARINALKPEHAHRRPKRARFSGFVPARVSLREFLPAGPPALAVFYRRAAAWTDSEKSDSSGFIFPDAAEVPPSSCLYLLGRDLAILNFIRRSGFLRLRFMRRGFPYFFLFAHRNRKARERATMRPARREK